MKTAVVYARYSSDRQTEQSIEGQLRVCQDYADRNDIMIIDTYIDRAMTGTNDNRMDFQRMIKDSSKKAWDYVLVYKLDRFSRNKYEMAMHRKTLRDNGIKVLSAMENIPDSPEGIILESLLEGMAEYYSAELSQKVKRGMNESRHKGQFTGGRVLYGYKVENKKILIDEDKASIIRFIYEKHLSGMYVKDIIKELTDKGIYFEGKPFKINTVHNFLRNEKYAGVVRYKNEVFTNIYPPIVTTETFNLVRQKMIANHYGKHPEENRYILRNKLICGCCGNIIHSGSGTGKNGKRKRYYICSARSKHKSCNKSIVKKELLEKVVIDTTYKIFDNPDNLNRLVNEIYDIHQAKVGSVTISNILERDRDTVKSAINNLIRCMEQGIVSDSTKTRLAELEEKLKDIEGKILLENAKYKIQLTKEDISKFIRTSLKKEAELLIELLVKKIILYDDKIEIYYNYTDKKNTLDDIQGSSFYKDYFEQEITNTKFNGEDYIVAYDIEAYI